MDLGDIQNLLQKSKKYLVASLDRTLTLQLTKDFFLRISSFINFSVETNLQH